MKIKNKNVKRIISLMLMFIILGFSFSAFAENWVGYVGSIRTSNDGNVYVHHGPDDMGGNPSVQCTTNATTGEVNRISGDYVNRYLANLLLAKALRLRVIWEGTLASGPSGQVLCDIHNVTTL